MTWPSMSRGGHRPGATPSAIGAWEQPGALWGACRHRLRQCSWSLEGEEEGEGGKME